MTHNLDAASLLRAFNAIAAKETEWDARHEDDWETFNELWSEPEEEIIDIEAEGIEVIELEVEEITLEDIKADWCEALTPMTDAERWDAMAESMFNIRGAY